MSQKGNVDVCPITKADWEARAAAKRGDCGDQSVYHCLADDQGGKWERCVKKSLIKEGHCPIFTSKWYIDWKQCNLSTPTCPNTAYFSNEVYKYSLCFGNNSQHERAKQIMRQKGKVDACPVTKEEWEARAATKSADCGRESVYHCLADDQGGYWEGCVERSLILEGFCPIVSYKGFVQRHPCNVSLPTCPNVSYVSNEVYKYSHCYGNNSLHQQTNTDHSKAEGAPFGAIIVIVYGLLKLVALLVALFIYCRRARKDQTTQNEEDGLQLVVPSGGESDDVVQEQNVDTGKTLIVVEKFGNSVPSTSRRILKLLEEI